MSHRSESTRETESAEQSQVLQYICLSYFDGSAIAPTLDCFSGLTQAIKSNTCSCIIIKGIDDSYLGLKINIACAFGTDIVLLALRGSDSGLIGILHRCRGRVSSEAANNNRLHCCRPDPGVLKCNVDASFHRSINMTSNGCCIRGTARTV
ncbi:hypothetical protein MTR_1g042750 [Medicago truncatula]|uniref:Uncharacterized protein n=1 Tax=Medicago truncatula TaxID=3880 RepID=G7I4N0_MEDTR|nr:hypothetical protein MTR_1g042750 [Medicago truncatula]